MWTVIIIIVLTVSMMVGPIMLMRPSQRQRYLGDLRAAAVQQGLQVRMAALPARGKTGEPVAVYARPWTTEKKKRSTWLLARQAFAHGVHFHNDWDWLDQRQAPSAVQAPLRAYLERLPASVLALEATSRSLGVYWLEPASEAASAEVAEVAAWLKDLVDMLD